MRKVSVGPLTIRLWIDADDLLCDECEERADELALCAATLADEDDPPGMLAERLTGILNGLSKVEVTDDTGNGVTVYP
jgi:hypothetical protein